MRTIARPALKPVLGAWGVIRISVFTVFTLFSIVFPLFTALWPDPIWELFFLEFRLRGPKGRRGKGIGEPKLPTIFLLRYL